MNLNTIFYFLISFFVGGMMVYGGYGKFTKPMPTSTQMLETLEKEGTQKMKENLKVLKIKNYIFGMKQTGYFWQLLGVCELLFGLMILSQYLRFAGAVMLVPITLHIFLFHLFLEFDEINELIQTGLLLLANLTLIGKEYSNWKHLILIKPF